MGTLNPEFDEIRIGIERLRALLEKLIVRGLRACGTDELLQLQSLTEYLEQCGAGHVASILTSLHSQIEKDDRTAARTLLQAQVSIRLLERLLTLRAVKGQYHAALAVAEIDGDDADGDDDTDDTDDTDDEDE